MAQQLNFPPKRTFASTGGTVYCARASMVKVLPNGDVQLGVPHRQKLDGVHGTCWANAMATTIRSIKDTIKDKDNVDLPDHKDYVQYLLRTYRDAEGNRPSTMEIAQAECAMRGLDCEYVDEGKAKNILTVHGRSILMSYGGDDDQSKAFQEFFKNKNDQEEEVLTAKRWGEWKGKGRKHRHAVCAIGYNSKKAGGAWKIQNSWGGDYKNGGFCFVEEGAWPKPKFIHISELQYYGVGVDKDTLVGVRLYAQDGMPCGIMFRIARDDNWLEPLGDVDENDDVKTIDLFEKNEYINKVEVGMRMGVGIKYIAFHTSLGKCVSAGSISISKGKSKGQDFQVFEEENLFQRLSGVWAQIGDDGVFWKIRFQWQNVKKKKKKKKAEEPSQKETDVAPKADSSKEKNDKSTEKDVAPTKVQPKPSQKKADAAPMKNDAQPPKANAQPNAPRNGQPNAPRNAQPNAPRNAQPNAPRNGQPNAPRNAQPRIGQPNAPPKRKAQKK